VQGLVSLKILSLMGNELEYLTSMSDLDKLEHLNLSGNKLTAGFHELAKLKSLLSLNLSNNNFNFTLRKFYSFLLVRISNLDLFITIIYYLLCVFILHKCVLLSLLLFIYLLCCAVAVEEAHEAAVAGHWEGQPRRQQHSELPAVGHPRAAPAQDPRRASRREIRSSSCTCVVVRGV
jgi:hypothetical protein